MLTWFPIEIETKSIQENPTKRQPTNMPNKISNQATANLNFFTVLPVFQKLDSFDLFAKLPGELQIMIWQVAAADLPVRTCVIRRARGGSYPDVASLNYAIGFQERWTTMFNPSCCSPVLFSICHDSRKVCKERYKLAFGGVDNRPVWFDFKKDVLNVQ
ncbi:hypothetical protein BKA64DRAFT_646405 [Cadophora sp. MPI-SDFR-AT-0126]|nr:hypothetical protein BKA64DRAFT_646405 [Leotiomycetes sp. MPI-SDFR-AT-0126]